MRVVAIQPDVPIGEVERSLDHLEDLIGQAAREHAPEAIFLPESMTTKNVYDRRMRHVARPIDVTDEAGARLLAGRLARALQASLLVRGAPAAVAGAANFGTITTALDPRVVQLAAKFIF